MLVKRSWCYLVPWDWEKDLCTVHFWMLPPTTKEKSCCFFFLKIKNEELLYFFSILKSAATIYASEYQVWRFLNARCNLWLPNQHLQCCWALCSAEFNYMAFLHMEDTNNRIALPGGDKNAHAFSLWAGLQNHWRTVRAHCAGIMAL